MAATSKKCKFSPYKRNKYIFTVDNMSMWVDLITVDLIILSLQLTLVLVSSVLFSCPVHTICAEDGWQ